MNAVLAVVLDALTPDAQAFLELVAGEVFFRDQTGAKPKALDLWAPVVITKEEIDPEIERLASLPQPDNGRRRSVIVHPRHKISTGMAPGIEVTLDVLKPGERPVPYRQNSTQVNFVIQGEGASVIGGRRFGMKLYDVANTQEVQVLVAGGLGESEAGGPTMNLVPQSGGNTFRGEGHYYTSGSPLSAGPVKRLVLNPTNDTTVQYVQDDKQRNLRNEFGGSVGGPIVKDRLFFFGAVSPLLVRQTDRQQTGFVIRIQIRR